MRSFLHLNVRNLRPSLESAVSYKKNMSVLQPGGRSDLLERVQSCLQGAV